MSSLPLPDEKPNSWFGLAVRLLTDDKTMCRAAFILALLAIGGVQLPAGQLAGAAAAAIAQAASPTPTPGP